jgi:hypothetical protein
LEVGWPINNMVREKKNGLTVQYLREVFFKVKRVEKELLNGPMAAATLVIFQGITSTERERIFGATNASSKDHGQTTKWKVTAYSLGQTAASTKVSTSMI